MQTELQSPPAVVCKTIAPLRVPCLSGAVRKSEATSSLNATPPNSFVVPLMGRLTRFEVQLRTRVWRVIVGALLLLCAVDDVFAQGQLTAHTVPDTGERYTLYVPKHFDAQQPNLLVVSLHFGGPVSPWYGRQLLQSVVEPALNALDAVMVAADCAGARWLDCEPTLERSIAHAEHHLSTSFVCRVLTGYSKGGIGTWDIGGHSPQRYAAAVVMAARAPDAQLRRNWRLPVRVIHGAHDELFAAGDVDRAVTALRNAGHDAALDLLPGVSHYQTHLFIEPLSQTVPWLQSLCARGQ